VVVTSILYFHGFASSPNSQKVSAIRKLVASVARLDAPDMNRPSFAKLDFEAIMDVAVEHGRRNPPRAIVGSSFGALIALEAVRRGTVAPLVLIAPAVGIGDRWITKLPSGDPIRVFNHALNAEAPIHRAFFEQMRSVRPEADPPASRASIVMGRNDESVPFSLVRGVWEAWTESGNLVPGSRFIEIAGGDHGLVAHAGVIAREILDALNET
jgi:pimeloyl-ACP methyl ester carboxylesterase